MLISSYVYIPVSDLEKAACWYEEKLGFTVIYKDTLYYDMRTETGVKIMLITNENHINSQMKFQSGLQPAYGFCVNDFDAIRKALSDGNTKIGEVFDYFGRSFSFYDLDGNKIEVWEDFDYNKN